METRGKVRTQSRKKTMQDLATWYNFPRLEETLQRYDYREFFEGFRYIRDPRIVMLLWNEMDHLKIYEDKTWKPEASRVLTQNWKLRYVLKYDTEIQNNTLPSVQEFAKVYVSAGGKTFTEVVDELREKRNNPDLVVVKT